MGSIPQAEQKWWCLSPRALTSSFQVPKAVATMLYTLALQGYSVGLKINRLLKSHYKAFSLRLTFMSVLKSFHNTSWAICLVKDE